MPLLMLRDLPRYDCLLEASQEFKELDVTATEACLHLLRAGDSVFRVLNGHLSKHVMSQGRFTVMMLLWEKPEGKFHTPAELADKAMVTRATITGLVDTLEKEGLVTRAHSVLDRRNVHVELTAKGREVIQGILPEHFRLMAQLLEPLSHPERKTFLNLLIKIINQAESVAPSRDEVSV